VNNWIQTQKRAIRSLLSFLGLLPGSQSRREREDGLLNNVCCVFFIVGVSQPSHAISSVPQLSASTAALPPWTAEFSQV